MKINKYILISLLAVFCSCSSLLLEPADFAWPVESVIKVNNQGDINIDRYSTKVNVKNLFTAETGDSTAYQNKELRVIRDSQGLYFMTAENFKNVYVFNVDDGALKLANKIEITDSTGLSNPAFNQRPPFVSLSYGTKKVNLTKDGIIEENGK